MKIERQPEHIRPLSNQNVKVKQCGHVTELLYNSGGAVTGIGIRLLEGGFYEVLATGEVKECHYIENRSENVITVARSLERLRDYINTNVDDVTHCRWLTLTYAENMTDTYRLYIDFQNFNRRMRKQVGQYEYITAAEPQGRGAWHLHVLMIFPDKAPFIPNEIVSNKWGQGFVTIKKLDSVDNVGAYLTAYLGDMEFEEALESGMRPSQISGHEIKEIEYEEDGQKKSKAYIKGARLRFYPANFNLYRCSKGIKKPTVTNMSAEKAEKKVSGATLTFERTFLLSDEDKGFSRILNYRYYNSQRKG